MMGPAHIKAASGSCACAHWCVAWGGFGSPGWASPASLLFQKVGFNLHLRTDVNVRISGLGLAAASCRKAWATCWSAKVMHLNVFTYRITIPCAHAGTHGMPSHTMA